MLGLTLDLKRGQLRKYLRQMISIRLARPKAA
jgi:hypothetical protein